MGRKAVSISLSILFLVLLLGGWSVSAEAFLNTPPIANAGPSQSVLVNNTVSLDGTASSDLDGDPLTYQWSLPTRPPGSAAILSSQTAVNPTFIADKPGVYVAQLIVNDGTNNSAPATVVIAALSCTPPPSGMISWWPAENSAIDIVDGNNGAIINNATFSLGMVGQAFNFSGSNDYIQVSSPVGLPVGNASRTMMLWFKTPINWGDAYQVVIQYGDNSAGGKFALYIPDYWSRTLSFWGESSDFSGSTPLQLDTWYHGAVTYDGSTVRLYLNGQFETSSAKALNTQINSGGLTIGHTSPLDLITSEWNGLVDEAVIFNRTLTQTEIQDIYNAAVAGICKTCVTPPSNMISWWSGDGHPFDLIDDNDGTLMGGATYAQGIVGKAFSFDGTDDYVEIPHSSSLDITGAITIDAWIYRNSSAHTGLLNKGAIGTNGVYDLALYQNKFYFRINGAALNMPSNADIPVNAWTHIAGTYDSATSTAKIYINGVLDNTQSYSGTINTDTNPLHIGLYGSPNLFFSGKIDELEIFNRALTQTEIQAIYTAGAAGKCKQCFDPPADMISWWPGDGHALDIVDDNDGALVGNATYADGKVGNAFSLDGGESNYVEIPNSSSLNPTGAFTIDGWFYIDPVAPGNTGEIATLIAKTEGSTNNGWALYFDDRWGTKSLKFVLGYVLELPNAIPTVNWYHIAAAFDPSTSPNSKLYINGALVASADSSGATANSLNVRIGAMHWTDSYHQGNDRLNGKADEVEFFSRALSAEEIAAIYAAGSAGKCKTASDADGDGIPNANDNCPSVSNPGQADNDGDGIGNVCDNCLSVANTNQADTDSDGIGDACDNCLSVANTNQADTDSDGIGDACDNCLSVANTNQADMDSDGIGDACDNCSSVANSGQEDNDADGLGNACDNCVNTANPGQENNDGDPIGDVCDTDDDHDGIPDTTEGAAPNSGDGNNDSQQDAMQDNVVSLQSATGPGYITVATSCDSIWNVQAHTEGSQPAPDNTYDFPYGLVSFMLPCPSATVTIYYHGVTSLNGFTYRKYGPTPPDFNNPQWYTLPGVTFGTVVIGGQTVATATFTLTDGGLGDDTSLDVVIVDQGGPGQPRQQVAIPSMTVWGMILFMFCAGSGAVWSIKRRRKV
jgi:hypothetical protein